MLGDSLRQHQCARRRQPPAPGILRIASLEWWSDQPSWMVCGKETELGKRTVAAELVQRIVAEDNDAALENLT